jgi:hypothetical protein
VTDPIHDAAQALLDALRFDRPSLMEAPLHTPQRRRFKALYAAAPFIRGEVAALTEALGTRTTDEVLWEGPTVMRARVLTDDPPDYSVSRIRTPYFDVPPGTRVRVVRATDPELPELEGGTWEAQRADLAGATPQRPRTMGENIRAKHDAAGCPWRPPHGCPDCVGPSTGDGGDDSPLELTFGATDQPSEEWVTRYLVKDGGDAYQQWIVVPDNEGYRSTPIECRIRAADVGEVDDELLWSATADQPEEVADDE